MSIFVTELPQDKYGNRAYTANQPRVVEVEQHPDRDWSYSVVGPDDFRSNWPSLAKRAWKEVAGPARILTEEEYDQLIS